MEMFLGRGMKRKHVWNAWICGAVTMLCVGAGWASASDAEGRPAESSPFCRDRVKVVKSGLAARLVADAPSYLPGSNAVFRVDVVGTVPIGLIGEEFIFERYEGDGWVKDLGSPKGFTKIRLGLLEAGESGFCRSFEIPPDTSAGRYRFRKDVVGGKKKRTVRLTSVFEVR